MTDPNARDLIQRLADALRKAEAALSDIGDAEREPGDDVQWCENRAAVALPITRNALAEARAYLAALDEPAVPDGREPASVAYEPSDAELLELMPETMRDEFAACASTYSAATGGQVKPGIFRTVLNTVALEYARVVLARWGSR